MPGPLQACRCEKRVGNRWTNAGAAPPAAAIVRLGDGAIIHRGENLNYAANGEGLSRSAPIRTTIIRYLRERGKKA